jgi:hypothetical protein
LVPVPGSELTGGLTYRDRKGTIIDWNLCFNAQGESSNRMFKSGTPAFMAPILLKDNQIFRRTLGHDMESFFAVIIWIATIDYTDEAAFLAKPLAMTMLDRKKTPADIMHAKVSWFKVPEEFFESITEYFDRPYREDDGFIECVFNLREILYPVGNFDLKARRHGGLDKNDKKVKKEDDPMKEGLFRRCMKEIDDYLHETNGCDEMQRIDSDAQHTPKDR